MLKAIFYFDFAFKPLYRFLYDAMTQKRLVPVVVVICILLVIVVAVLLYCSNDHPDNNSDNSNADVVAMEDYIVQDAEVESFTEGSVIVQKDSDTLIIRVIGTVNVGNDDFGGVCFYFGEDMALDSIITSYRDELGAESVLIERIPGDSPFSGGTSVSFGRTPMMSGDGVFEIVYEYVGDQPIEDIDSVSLAIAVGSYYIDGSPAVGHVYETIEITL